AKSIVQTLGVDFWINVPVGHEYVRPSIVVDVQKHRSPAQELTIFPQSSFKSHVRKGSIAVVVIERGSVVREICLNDVQPSIAIVVDRMSAHTSLFPAIIVEGNAREHAGFRESAVVIIVEEQTRGGIAGYKNIRPAIVIEISGQHGEAIVGGSFGHA